MERLKPEEADFFREITLSLANTLIRIEKGETEKLYPNPIFCDVSLFENLWGVKFFEKPLFTANFSDETYEEGEEDFLGEPAFVPGWDNTITIYQSSADYLFGLVHGQGTFGDHITERGIIAYKSKLSEDDLKVKKVKNTLEEYHQKDQIHTPEKDEILPRKILVASLEDNEIVYTKTIHIPKIWRGIQFLSLGGKYFVDLALSGKYFVCIARPDRIGKYLESREEFDITSVGELFCR